MLPRRLRSLPPCLAIAALAPRALAADCDPQSRVSTCIDADNLWMRPGPSQFASVGGTSLTAPGQIGFGLMASFQKRPIVLRLPSAEPGGTDAYAIDNQANATLLWSLGLTERLEVSAAAPVTMFQDGVGATPLTQQQPTPLVRSTVRDLRLGGAFALVPRRGGFVTPGPSAVFRLDVALPTGDESVFAGGRGPTFAPSLVGDYRIGPVVVALEAGARVRKASEIAGVSIGTQTYEALGVGVDVLPNELLSANAEIFSLQSLGASHALSRENGALVEGDTRPMNVPTEWMLTFRSAPARGGDFSFHAGGGTGIPVTESNVTSPSFRFVAGLRYAPLGRDSDGDGIPDRDDKCPNEPEDKDGFEDDDGCPDPDNDQDGILDKDDKCPNQPETINGVDDEDGCPEPNAKDLVSIDKTWHVVLEAPVRFAAGNAKMTPAIEKQLRMAAQKARGVKGFERVVVETYGDAPQPAAKQEDLANKRAEAVRAVLLSAGLTADNVTVAIGDISAKRPAKASHVDMLVLRKRAPK